MPHCDGTPLCPVKSRVKSLVVIVVVVVVVVVGADDGYVVVDVDDGYDVVVFVVVDSLPT